MDPTTIKSDVYYTASEAFDATTDSGLCDLANMDPEQKAKLEEEWKIELARTEEEIHTLKHVLSSKMHHATELKRKLGITVWRELRDDLGQGVKNIQESTASGLGSNIGMFTTPAYQKTTEVVKAAGERTSSMFGALGGNMAKRLGDVRNSNAFKSIEERVGSLKDKMVGSRSNSTNSFEDALEHTNRRTSSTSPTIAEERVCHGGVIYKTR